MMTRTHKHTQQKNTDLILEGRLLVLNLLLQGSDLLLRRLKRSAGLSNDLLAALEHGPELLDFLLLVTQFLLQCLTLLLCSLELALRLLQLLFVLRLNTGESGCMLGELLLVLLFQGAQGLETQ